MRQLILLVFSITLFFSGTTLAQPKGKTIDADVVVVGSGLAGLSAAANSSELGLKTVLIEKVAALGGSAPFVEGTFAVGSKMQMHDSIAMTPDQAWRIAMEYSHWVANGAVLRVLIDRSAETVDWLKDKGVIFSKVHTVILDGPRTWHLYQNGSGATAVRTLVDVIKKNGGMTMTETTGTRLIMDSQKNVVGLIALNAEGEEIQFNTKAVILATGGFANNKEMLKKFLKNPDMIIVGPQKGRTGDGIRMAQEAGAAVEGMTTFLPIGAMLPGEDPNPQLSKGVTGQMTAVLRQPFLWVNRTGERFIDESVAANWVSTHNAVERNGNTYFIVFDEDTKKELMTTGTVSPFSDWVPGGTVLDKLDEGLKQGETKGYVYTASSIDALADKMGISKTAFKQTVEQNNRFYAQHHDAVFDKQYRYMRPVSKGPFYAIRGTPAFLNTTGGVTVNPSMQVVNGNGVAIKGLYAAGVDIGGLFGDSYDLQLPGTLSGYAVTAGRIASEHIAKNYK